MNSNRPFRVCMLLALATGLLLSASTSAQTTTMTADRPATAGEEGKTRASSSDSSSAKDDIEHLRSKIDQLVLLVERQQQAMAELERRLNSITPRPETAAVNTASLKVPVGNSTPTTDSGTMSAGPAQSQTQPIESRLQKVGGQSADSQEKESGLAGTAFPTPGGTGNRGMWKSGTFDDA